MYLWFYNKTLSTDIRGKGELMMAFHLRIVTSLLLGIRVLAETGSEAIQLTPVPSALPTWGGEGAPLAPENPECASINLIFEANTTSERCRVCYSTPNCAFCIDHGRGDKFPAPECLQLRDLNTPNHCSIQQAWFPGRQNWKGLNNELPNQKRRSYEQGADVLFNEDIRFCDEIYVDYPPVSWGVIWLVGIGLCPLFTCIAYCCTFVKRCPLAPPNVDSKYKYAIENFFNSDSKYGFPGTDGSLMSNYWQYINNQDEFLSVLFAHPLNPFGRVKRALALLTVILWKCAMTAAFSKVYANKEDAYKFIGLVITISILTVPLRIFLEECARARLLHFMGCGVWLAERLSVVLFTITFTLAFYSYACFLRGGTKNSSFSSGAIALSILQSWFLKHVILRLNYTTINSWKGGSLCLPQLHHQAMGEELGPVNGAFSIFSYSPVAYILQSVLYGVGESTFFEDKKKFFEQYGAFSSIDVYLEQSNYGKIDLSGKSALARTSTPGIDMFTNPLHSSSKRLSNGQLAMT